MISRGITYKHVKGIFSISVFILIAFLRPSVFFAQESANGDSVYAYFDSQYGLDSELYRGRKYISLTKYSKGSPFFSSEEMEAQKRRDAFFNKETYLNNTSINFSKGKIVVDNKLYCDVQLSYDVYMQEVIVKSIGASGLSNELVILNSRIDEFWIGEHHFVKNPHKEIDALYLEKIKSENTEAVCYFSYTKEYRLQQDIGKGEMGFGDLRSKKYLYSNDKLYPFRGKNRFLKGLSTGDKEQALIYIKSLPDKFKNSDSLYFKLLLESLSEKTQVDGN